MKNMLVSLLLGRESKEVLIAVFARFARVI